MACRPFMPSPASWRARSSRWLRDNFTSLALGVGALGFTAVLPANLLPAERERTEADPYAAGPPLTRAERHAWRELAATLTAEQE